MFEFSFYNCYDLFEYLTAQAERQDPFQEDEERMDDANASIALAGDASGEVDWTMLTPNKQHIKKVRTTRNIAYIAHIRYNCV